jgi:hypothetical protein
MVCMPQDAYEPSGSDDEFVPVKTSRRKAAAKTKAKPEPKRKAARKAKVVESDSDEEVCILLRASP